MNEGKIPKEVLKMEVKGKHTRGRQIKMGTTAWDRCHTERRKNMGRN
jgi:hypothetical protein